MNKKDFQELQALLDRLSETVEDLKLAISGTCPECRQRVSRWEPPGPLYAEEYTAALESMNIDVNTGHKKGCSKNQKGE